MTKVHMLFSMDNNYDQPDRAFVCWWNGKPSIETVAKVLKVDFSKANDDIIAAVVSIWLGKRCELGGTAFWIEEVQGGVPPQ